MRVISISCRKDDSQAYAGLVKALTERFVGNFVCESDHGPAGGTRWDRELEDRAN